MAKKSIITILLAILLMSFDVLPPEGMLIYDSNGDPFPVSGSGKVLQKNYTFGTHWMTNAVDFEMELGAVVMAAFPGVIVRADSDSAHGVFVIVEGDNGIAGRYCHLSEADLDRLNSRIGERVELGDKLGRIGKTGNTAGNHLDFELGYVDSHNPDNNYFSSTPEQREYYNYIINLLIDKNSKGE